ncbi:MAG: DUF4270 domain-containing protein [Muribaculaceae bacterium]|nr:DUF4270 domain-containing protein [Muribaculaceae bacterium]
MTLSNSLRKRIGLLAAPFLTIAAGGLLLSCEDKTPTVGGALASGEVQIALDSLTWNGTDQTIHRGEQQKTVFCPKISYVTIFNDSVDTRSTSNLIGRISVPEYGDLNCSFVSRLMCTTTLDIPDSISKKPERIDSMKLVLTVPRGALTGDSLAPQQLRVFELTKSLPNDIDNRFDPTGYYDPANPLGTRSYTLSALGMSDSLYSTRRYVDIEIPMSREMALKTVEAYTNQATKDIFAWPQTFEKYFHGIYVEPSFGRGCVANIALTNFLIYYHYYAMESTQDAEGKPVETLTTKVGCTGVFASSPIVLSSNNVIYRPSENLKAMAAENQALITTPGGYQIKFKFPGKELVDIYNTNQSKLAVVSSLKFQIPVEEIQNDYGLAPCPYLLMIKSSKLKEFLASNSLPDDKESFYAKYDKKKKRYDFESMRDYILGLIQKGINEDDLDMTIIPVNLEFETNQQTNYNPWYGTSSSSGQQYLTKCTPYIAGPTMCRLKMDEAQTIFTYSLQQMR